MSCTMGGSEMRDEAIVQSLTQFSDVQVHHRVPWEVTRLLWVGHMRGYTDATWRWQKDDMRARHNGPTLTRYGGDMLKGTSVVLVTNMEALSKRGRIRT